MDNQGYTRIPDALCHWITFLAQALPLRSVPTFIELLIGAMLTQAGFVTQAWLAVPMKRHWGSYFKWLQRGKWSWVALGRQMGRLLGQRFGQCPWFLVIDDTVVFRASRQAPGSRIHHQHGTKANRPDYVRGQCWVTLAAVVEKGSRHCTIPLLSRLTRVSGNSSKLIIACTLLRAMRGVFAAPKTVLVDSWYMRRVLILSALEMGYQVIGQVRKDTALYGQPIPTGGRGRPRTYGPKYTAERVAKLSVRRRRMRLYGKDQWVHYRSVVARARFLGGRRVRVVWVQFEDANGQLRSPRLLLATDETLSAEAVIHRYAKRWGIEPMFFQVKNLWGWRETWQQSRQVLHRWLQILSLGYALPQLLALIGDEEVTALANLAPWRTRQPVTAGRVRLGLQRIFCHVRVREWWNPKSRKFMPPGRNASPPDEAVWREAA